MTRRVNHNSWPPTNPVAAHPQAHPHRLARLLLRIVFRSECQRFLPLRNLFLTFPQQLWQAVEVRDMPT